MKITRRIFYFLAVFVIFCGCTPSYPPIDAKRVPSFKVRESVKLTNAQKSSEDISIRFSKVGHGEPAETFTVNYRGYTEDALQLLEGELEKKNAAISESAAKEIELAIVGIKMVPVQGFEAFPLVLRGCILNYTVETGNGYEKATEAVSFSWEFETAIEMAVVELVIGVLNDKNILNYLEN